MADVTALIADLTAEGAELDAIVAGQPEAWGTPTPAQGWTVAHQIAHLHWTDIAAAVPGMEPGQTRVLYRDASGHLGDRP